MTMKRVYASQATIEFVIGVLSRKGTLARMLGMVEEEGRLLWSTRNIPYHLLLVPYW